MKKGNRGHKRRTQPNLKSFIIEIYKNHPDLSLKRIAEISGASYNYVRKVISMWRRGEVTFRGGPSTPSLPVHVHGFWFVARLPPDDYVRCPLPVSNNRNRQKVYRGRFVRVVLFPSGNMVVYPLYPGLPDWRDELKRWLESWLPSGYVELVLKSLESRGEYQISAWIPPNYLPKTLKFRIKGLGKFHVDKTPFKDTLEFTADPEFLKMGGMLRELKNTIAYQSQIIKHLCDTQMENSLAIREFAEQIRLHLDVMRGLRREVERLSNTLDRLEKILSRLEEKG